MPKAKSELEVLLKFSSAANAATTINEVLREIISSVRGGFGYDRVSVYLADPSDSRKLTGVMGTDAEGREIPTAIPLRSSCAELRRR